MAPLWLMYPELKRDSSLWKTEAAMNYFKAFTSWYSSLSHTDKNQYQLLFPEPECWYGWYENKEVITSHIENDASFLKQTQNEYKKGKKIKFLFFWGHQPSADGSIIKSCMSQWWNSDFSVESVTYSSMEQYMMAEKARLFKDEETLLKILNNKNPKKIKALGREVKNFNEDSWKEHRYSIVLHGNLMKFLQNEELKEFLLNTKNHTLVEASPYDNVWGSHFLKVIKRLTILYNGKGLTSWAML